MAFGKSSHRFKNGEVQTEECMKAGVPFSRGPAVAATTREEDVGGGYAKTAVVLRRS
jgi:hypothetical protein